MKQVLLKSGQAIVDNIPSPQVSDKNILVKVAYSCISVGTESASLKMSSLPLYKRALKQPENVKKVLEMIKNQGIQQTFDRVTGKLAAGSPSGYSVAGEIVAIGNLVAGFSIGDMVACAGAGIANHAEYVNVPVNLAVKVPESVSLAEASTVTLGSIAMQGVRRMNATLGETVVVVGLGVLGQMTVQMLKANGCRVIGTDLDTRRIQTAIDNGMDAGASTSDEVRRLTDLLTDGIGADGVVITASSESNEIVSLSMQITRRKGRVVLVGDVGLNLKRSDFYIKEIDFFISTSYGPGRYDPYYEEDGQDYPIGYVRWTENRNMSEYLRLIGTQQIKIKDFFNTNIYDIEKAADAFAALQKANNEKPLMVLLSYKSPNNGHLLNRIDITQDRAKKIREDTVKVGLAGAGGFALGMHLPNMQTLKEYFHIHAIMSRTGSNAKAVAQQYSAHYATTNYEDLLKDESLDLVMITTRHNLHASMVLAALKAGKHVFVEKPLAINQAELEEIKSYFHNNPGTTQLLVSGFNRRFAPIIDKVRQKIANRVNPLIINYTMNAGYIPKENWVHGLEGGGRNIGEACHIYDLFNSLTNSKPIEIKVNSINPSGLKFGKNDNFTTTIKYKDGSICTLTYTSMGNKVYGKEYMDVFCDGVIFKMSDFKTLDIYGSTLKTEKLTSVDKGQFELLKQTGDYLKGKRENWPISLEDQISATEVSFEIENQILRSK